MLRKISFKIVVLLSGLVVNSCSREPAEPVPSHTAAAPPALNDSPEGKSYAPDSVFRPDVDRPPERPTRERVLTVESSVKASDESPFSYFGHSVDMDRSFLVVGAPYADTRFTDAGKAYVFSGGSGGWRQVARLVPSSQSAYARFGWAVAISGATVVVGADRQAQDGVPGTGAAEVFSAAGAGGAWRWIATLRPDALLPGDALGSSVAIDGDTMAVGAPGRAAGPSSPGSGAVFVYRRRGQGWHLEAQLSAPAPEPHVAFGHSVAVAGDTLLVGAIGANALSGAAYVFRHRQGKWELETELGRPHVGALERYGASVALDQDWAMIGHPRAPIGERTRAGAVHVFQRREEGWVHVEALVAQPARSDEEFGRAISLSGGWLVVGTQFGDDAGLNTGLGYLFRHQGGQWSFQRALLARGARSMDEVGTAVALSGEVVAMGGPRHGPKSNATGEVFLAPLPAPINDAVSVGNP